MLPHDAHVHMSKHADLLSYLSHSTFTSALLQPKEHVAPAHLHAQKNLTNSGDAALFVYPVSAGSSSASASPDGSEGTLSTWHACTALARRL